MKPKSSAFFLAKHFFLFLLLFITVALLLLFVTCSPDPNTNHRQIFAMEIPQSGMSLGVKEFLERIEIHCSAHCWASGMTWNAYKVCRESAAGILNPCKWLLVYGKITHLGTKHLWHFLLSAFRGTLNQQITLSDHPDTISELCHGWKPISRFKLCVLERTHNTFNAVLPFWSLRTL